MASQQATRTRAVKSLTSSKCGALRNARSRLPPAWCYQLVSADCEAHYVRHNGRAALRRRR